MTLQEFTQQYEGLIYAGEKDEVAIDALMLIMSNLSDVQHMQELNTEANDRLNAVKTLVSNLRRMLKTEGRKKQKNFPIENGEDRGFYSDIYKEQYGSRPRHLTNEQLENWMEANFIVEGNKIAKRA